MSLSAPCHSWEWAEQCFCGGGHTIHTDSKNHTCGWKQHSVQVRITLNLYKCIIHSFNCICSHWDSLWSCVWMWPGFSAALCRIPHYVLISLHFGVNKLTLEQLWKRPLKRPSLGPHKPQMGCWKEETVAIFTNNMSLKQSSRFGPFSNRLSGVSDFIRQVTVSLPTYGWGLVLGFFKIDTEVPFQTEPLLIYFLSQRMCRALWHSQVDPQRLIVHILGDEKGEMGSKVAVLPVAL